MSFLSKLLAEREYSLPPFDLAPLAFELQSLEEGELLLDRVVSPGDGQANVVALSGPVPTAGELRESIERHLTMVATSNLRRWTPSMNSAPRWQSSGARSASYSATVRASIVSATEPSSPHSSSPASAMSATT